MEPRDQLRQIVAQLAGLTTETINAAFSLRSRGFQSSVRRAALAAAIRRHLNVNVPEAYSATSFQELEAAVFRDGAQPVKVAQALAPVSPVVGSSPLGGLDDLACGIDIEMVDSMPLANDYWEHEFYRESFSKDEIAYCVLQENPRMHFAARWCAKEAMVKCDPTLTGQPFSTIEVIRSESGQVFLRHQVNGHSRKPVAISMSHTDTMAAAVVVRNQK